MSRQLTVQEQTRVVLALSEQESPNGLRLAREVQHGVLFLITDEQDALQLKDLIDRPVTRDYLNSPYPKPFPERKS